MISHALEAADPLELAEIKRLWEPYINQLPEYAYLCKDLSGNVRRNYIEFGQYTDYLFPSLGCRFIALNNGIDTMSDNGSTDVMCFLNLFNEFYSRDTSKKVKGKRPT